MPASKLSVAELSPNKPFIYWGLLEYDNPDINARTMSST